MRVIDDVSRDLWDQVAARCPYATFFHTPVWAETLVQTYPQMRIETKGFELDDGVVAIVPLVATVERNRYFKWYESMFPGAYGGVVAERPLRQAEVRWIFEHLPNSHTAYIHVMGNPYADHVLPSSYRQARLRTHVLDLAGGFEAIRRGFSHGHKYSIKKAMGMGVEIVEATTLDEFRYHYDHAYQDSLRRWGDNVLEIYPYELFERIYYNCAGRVKLWVARVDRKPVAGNLVFYHNGHAVTWHAATVERYFNHCPSQLLESAIIKNACRTGFTHYDFNPSGGLAGVEQYKQAFGAQPVPFNSYEWRDNPFYRGYHNVRTLASGLMNRNAGRSSREDDLQGAASRADVLNTPRRSARPGAADPGRGAKCTSY